jgi:hypothetical protein
MKLRNLNHIMGFYDVMRQHKQDVKVYPNMLKRVRSVWVRAPSKTDATQGHEFVLSI